MKAIKEYLFKKELSRVTPQEKTFLKTKTNVIESVTILTDAQHHSVDEMLEAVNAFVKIGIDCDGFLINAQTNEPVDERIELITPKDCKWYNVPKQEVLVKWLQHKTNLLITVNKSAHPAIKYLTATSNSLLKSAVVFDDTMTDSVNFSLQADPNKKQTLKELSITLYRELIKINTPR